jgi:glutamate synthase domain-containing protein 1
MQKNAGGEFSGSMLDERVFPAKHSSAGEVASSTMPLEEQIVLARENIQKLKDKPAVNASELEEAEDLLRELELRQKAETRE